MIYTVTFCPSLDYAMTVPDFTIGKVNRTLTENLRPGGKGVNVSVVLSNLQMRSKALGFVGGFVGGEIERQLSQMGVQTEFIQSQGLSRINVKILCSQETEINGQGTQTTLEDVEVLLNKLSALQNGDVLVLAGTVPSCLPSNIYERILSSLNDGVLTVVDSNNKLLTNILKYRPFLIKPNDKELAEILQKKTDTLPLIAAGAKELQARGARNVAVSRGGKGAVLVCENGEVYSAQAPSGTVVNTVGAGDSLVAGFVAGYLQTGKFDYALRMGVAAGSASAFSPSLATQAEINNLLDKVIINKED